MQWGWGCQPGRAWEARWVKEAIEQWAVECTSPKPWCQSLRSAGRGSHTAWEIRVWAEWGVIPTINMVCWSPSGGKMASGGGVVHVRVCVHLYVYYTHIHTFPSFIHWKNLETAILQQRWTPLVPKSWSLSTILHKRNQGPLEKWLISGLIWGKYNINLDHLSVQESKDVLKEWSRHVKRMSEELTTNQIWASK